MKRKETTVSRLRLGQRFTWVPEHWYGEGVLIYKARREDAYFDRQGRGRMRSRYIYDLKYKAAVVNPPAVVYGVPANTKIKVITA